MSFDAMKLVLNAPGLSHLEFRVLAHLAGSSDNKTYETYTSQKTIASKINVHRPAVSRAMAELEKLKYIERFATTKHATMHTRLLVDNIQQAITAAACEAVSGNTTLPSGEHDVTSAGNTMLPSGERDVTTPVTSRYQAGNTTLPITNKLSSQLSKQVSGAGVIKSVISAREGQTATTPAPVDNNGYPVCEGQTDVLSELATGSERKPTHTEALQRARLRAQEEKRQREMQRNAS